MKNLNKLLLFIICPCFTIACSSGSSGNNSSTALNIVTVPTFNYEPGNKTAVMASIGGGELVIAEIDTGSEMTVVNESAVGSNIIKTSESIQIVYGAGTNTVSGYLAYGSVEFTTSSGNVLATSPNTPILVVESGDVNQGGGNNAILGMRMDNQVSSRLFLPFPYNQMMILNKSESFIAFGSLSSTQLKNFATISQIAVTCDNLDIPATLSNSCWGTTESSVTYSYSLASGGTGNTNYTTIFDSGEAIGNFYLGAGVPNWMQLDNHNFITTQLSATINTNIGPIPLPLTIPMRYTQPLSSSTNTVNPGNQLFDTYQVLFNQVNGEIGFLAYNESW